MSQSTLKNLAVDAAHLAVAGDSVGGNMAVTNADFESGSYKQFADGPWLTRRAMQWFWDQYLPDHNKRKDSTASPLLASLEQLTRLPRALIIRPKTIRCAMRARHTAEN